MSNSVVKVTDSTPNNDSLLLLVCEDGTVTPSKDVVEAYLSSKPGITNLQVMHVNKSDNQSIEVDVDNMLYLPDIETTCNEEPNLDEIAYNLYNVKLDHDYTSYGGPSEEIDELAKTLSILDGSSETPLPITAKSSENKNSDQFILDTTTQDNTASKNKCINTPIKSFYKSPEKKEKTKSVNDGNVSCDKYSGGDECINFDESDNTKLKTHKKIYKHEIKSDSGKSVKQTDTVKSAKPVLTVQDSKLVDKKLLKKDKKVVKQAPDDFALFSTPDIIRRVKGKDPTTTNYSSTSMLEFDPTDTKPAKIEGRSKSFSESPTNSKKSNRLSLDAKVADKQTFKLENSNIEKKFNITKLKKGSVEFASVENDEVTKSNDDSKCAESVEPEGVNFVAINNETKAFSGNLSTETSDLSGNEHMISDGNSLDLDPALLENINSELISEDILYQVAQSLVANTELQNAIDKSLNEDNLVLQTAVQEAASPKCEVAQEISEPVTSRSTQKGTQIIRPDGRIVVIPPIERPTTRSRNKKKDEEITSSRLSRKPLDEEHVSGNELDSSEEDEEESEDDPNKLWCICNQPHNNRFMICCDTCEEWYHGKCVNITKAMGQQMESEGREWICLFCKDPLLKRPQSAAKRIRKASRNSRQSSDSNGSSKVPESKSSSVPCVVCHKPSRTNSIFCSEACILIHAQGVERVVVFERATGNMLTGNKAPSAANLEQWLKDHPGYEVVRSAGKIVTTKQTQNISPTKLRVLKHVQNNRDLTDKKNSSGGISKHFVKSPHQIGSPSAKGSIGGAKILNKQIASSQQKEKPHQSSPNKDAIISSTSKMKSQNTLKSSVINPNKEKLLTGKIQKIRHSDQTSSTSSQPKQENIRDNVQKTIFEQLTNRLRMVDDLKLSEEELKEISNEIESQLYKCFGDTGQKYRNKYRSLIFNIKDVKNQTLWRRICEKSINPYQLVRLSPDDLASQELALWREREAKHQLDMIKKSELELLKCNRQYVLKTHKGEQILEDNRPTDHIDNTEVITSLTDGSNGTKSERKTDNVKDSKKHKHKDKEKRSRDKSSSKSHSNHRSSSRDHDRSRKRSHSKDRSSKHGDKRSRSRERERDKYKKSSHKGSRHRKDAYRGSSTEKLDKKSKEILEQLVDNKIVPPLEDRLWKHVSQEDILPTPLAESDSDHEPSSTVTIPTPPRNNDSDDFSANQVTTPIKNDKPLTKERIETVNTSLPSRQSESEEIWRGIINMIDVAQISITAHEVSGDCSGLASELPSNLDIVGRISPDTVWDYIGKMKCSNSKIISIVRLNATNVEEKMPYLALYSYLSSRNRLGVVKSTNKAVKDFYILPLASQKPIPQALLPLNGPGFEEARPALLLGIIVRDKRKRPYVDVVSPAAVSVKKPKTEIPTVQVTPTSRSYTPPPIKESALKLPLPPAVLDTDGDEPYSPEDSDPDSITPSTSESVTNNSTSFLESEVGSSQTFQPFVNKFDDIPGLDNATLPSSTQEIQRQMEKLNKEIEMQKSEINSISQNIATASTEIGTSALANIALPSNLQQILDSIKTIGSTPTTEKVDTKTPDAELIPENSDFTIPLMLPTSFSRHAVNTSLENTIPLNLPCKKKSLTESDKSNSVLSTLSEEDLIRKAEEMLEDSDKGNTNFSSKPTNSHSGVSNYSSSQKLPNVELSPENTEK